MKNWLTVAALVGAAGVFCAENLVKNGDFSRILPNGKPAEWTVDFKKGEGIATPENTARFRGKGDGGGWFVQEIPVLPAENYVLTLRARAKADAEQPNFSSCVLVFFRNAKGQWIGAKRLRDLAYKNPKWVNSTVIPDGQWRKLEFKITTPSDAAGIGIRLDATGPLEAEWDDVELRASDLTVAKVLGKYAPPADLPTPGPVAAHGVTLTADWSPRDAFTESNPFRFRQSLNGLWGYRPAGAATPWAFCKIPGAVRDAQGFMTLYNNTAKYKYSEPGPRWLVRTVEFPERPGCAWSLLFEGSSNLACRVFWNGDAIGTVDGDWGGEIPIPANLCRAKNELKILALPRKSDGANGFRYSVGGKPRPFEAPAPWSDGILYDVDLIGRPAEPVFERVRITPSWRKKALFVRVPGAPENRVCRAAVADRAGKKLLEFSGKFRNGELAIPWTNPVEWTPDTPNLLTLELSIRTDDGRELDRSLPLEFGFREIWRDGRILYLNGRELRLRPRMSMIYSPMPDTGFFRRGFRYLKQMGFNTITRLSDMQDTENYFRGTAPVRLADEMGLFFMAYTPLSLVSGGQFMSRDAIDVDPDLVRDIDRKVVERYYNHPSVIAYSGFGTSPGFGDGVNYANHPRCWGIDPLDSEKRIDELRRDNIITDDSIVPRMKASVRFVRELRKLDPSRPFLSHYDCGAGDGWGVFDYFNWTPIQEWEEWIAHYPKHGVKPIGSMEHGNPYPMSFVNHAVPDGDNEPWLTEYAAGWLGERAYGLESSEYRELVRKYYDPVRKAWGGAHYATGWVNRQRAAHEVWSKFNTRLYRSWRLLGVNMGIEPFGPADNYVEKEVLERGCNRFLSDPSVNLKTPGIKADFLRRVGMWPNEAMWDPPAPPEGLTAYGRALSENNGPFLGFVAGGGENPLNKIHLYASGETVEKQIALIFDGFLPLAGIVEGTVTLGGKTVQKIHRDFRFDAPGTRLLPLEFKTAGTGNGAIELRFRDSAGKELGRDRFAFTVVPRVEPNRSGAVLFDPAGTAGQAAAFAEKTVRTPAFDGARLVLIAPGALRDGVLDAVPAGIPVMVLAQSPETLEAIGLRTWPGRFREFLPDRSSAIDPELLRDWRAGAPRKLDDSTAPRRRGYNNVSSDTGLVADTAIETPDRGNFTPLAHGGFDLAATPLLLTELGNRKVLFCQLEFAKNATAEPAAAIVYNRLRGILSAPIVRRNVKLVRGPADAARLRDSGEPAVVLPQSDEFYRTLGVPFRRVVAAVVPGSDSVAGLNAGNFHARQDLPWVVFGDGSPVTRVGELTLVGFDPETLDIRKHPYLRLTRIRQTRALAQILNNAGARDDAASALAVRLKHAPVNHSVRFQSSRLRPTPKADGADWTAPGFREQGWRDFAIEKNLTGLIDAQIRCRFRVPADIGRQFDLVLDAGTFDDFDQIWLNGVKIGETTPANADPDTAWSRRRRYPIPDGLLKSGDNVLAIRAWNRNGPSKGWNAIVRGPFIIADRIPAVSPYSIPARHCDDPYLLHQW